MKNCTSFFFMAIPILVLTLFSCQNTHEKGKEIGNLYLSNEFPSPGDSLSIVYTPLSTMLANDENLESIVRYVVKDKLYSYDIDLKVKDSIWSGTIHLPDSAVAAVFNFEKGGIKDNNDKNGYAIPFFDGDNKPLKGSHAGIAYQFSWFGKSEMREMRHDSILTLFEMDFEYGTEKSDWDLAYSRLLLFSDKSEGIKYIEDRIEHYNSIENLTENEYNLLANLYGLSEKKDFADSIQKVGIDKFPKGAMAQDDALNRFLSEKDFSKQAQLLDEFKENYGVDTDVYDIMLSVISRKYSENGDLDSFLKYSGQINNKQNITSLYNNLAWNNALKEENLDFAEKISRESLYITKELQDDFSKKPNFYSENQYKKFLKGQYLMYVDTYALILFKQGKIKDAIKYQREAMGEKKMGSPEVNERYIQFLLADNRFEETMKDAMHFVRNDVATEKIKEYLREAYIKTHGSSDGLEEVLQDLEKEAHMKGIAKIREKMINERSHDFTLKNLDGEEVALKDLRGKTVILDFWATWCGPCIASFPGMQMAVNKYKDNPNVIFLFIDTMEKGTFDEKKKKVSDFLTKNKYTFNVLLDIPRNNDGRLFLTADNYGIWGIPAKVVIGPDGNIKFKSTGSAGNPSKIVEELDQIVEIIQKDIQETLMNTGIGDFHTYIIEHIVRLLEIRIADKFIGEKQAEELRKVNSAFIWLPQMEELIIKDYESNQEKYSNFSDFIPELLSVVN